MATQFDRWEKDPFFSAAEEVQESSDRMESTYRTWIHSKKDTSGLWNIDELRRDLQTALGTTKWQLEEFERAVNSSYRNSSADDSKDRHRNFIIAIESQVSKVEKSLNESIVSLGKPPLPWVRLDEGECSELAAFLSAPSTAASVDKNFGRFIAKDQQAVNSEDTDIPSVPELSRDSSHTLEQDRLEAKEERFPGHRRTASAGADIGAWKISVSDDVSPPSLSNEQPGLPPRKIPSFSGFLNSMESASKLKWPKNGYRKLKPMDHSKEADILPRSQHLARGLDACYESKSCLDSGDDCYDKQIYSWYGAIQRQLQRSQYHMQYSRPAQVVLSVVVLICVIVLLVLRT